MEHGDSSLILPSMKDKTFDFVIGDPPYENSTLINMAAYEGRRISRGALVLFMYPEDVQTLEYKPDQITHWVKPISTKNTAKRYSRFVEAICVWHGDLFNQELHWSTRSGVFTDSLIDKQDHAHKKPESLIEKLIKLHCPPGGAILDPFGGSGTVETVGTRLGYSVRSIEISQELVDKFNESKKDEK